MRWRRNHKYHLTVDGVHYVVDTDDDLTLWRTSVTDAMHSGGGLVNVTDTAGLDPNTDVPKRPCGISLAGTEQCVGGGQLEVDQSDQFVGVH